MSSKFYSLTILCLTFCTSFLLNAQNPLDTNEFNEVITSYLNNNKDKYGFEDNDISNLVVNSQLYSSSTGLTSVYVNQAFDNKRIFNAISSVAIKEGKVFYYANRFLNNINARINTTAPSLSPQGAIQNAASDLELGAIAGLEQLQSEGNSYTFSNASISSLDIVVELVFVPVEESLKLAWDFTIYKPDNSNWWSIRVDAVDGSIIDAKDLILTCQFDNPKDHLADGHKHELNTNFFNRATSPNSILVDGSSYNVFPLPLESPNHGPRQIVTNPADPVSSPFGWHDTDGIAGPEFTITRGNNVIAKEDANGDNEQSGIGYAPDGTSALNFDFPLDFSLAPLGYQDAAITNLFYVNNMMHDIWFNHGFDEASGNFQQTNYGDPTGTFGANDFVVADAQDGSGFNNANFGTPPDGFNPRMQMFLWTPPGGGSSDRVEVLNGSLAGEYPGLGAGFGAGLSSTVPVTGTLKLATDGIGDTYDACEILNNQPSLNGNIAIIRRGSCEFGTKVLSAQNAGAIAVIIVNNVAGGLVLMGPGADGGLVSIPSLMVNQTFGEQLIAALENGEDITANLLGPDLTDYIDGDFDNGIIAHEYGHGISNRLAGGRRTASCLFNDEQMGEGWSDWFGLMITMTPADLPENIRGIGTFAISQPTTGGGIRPAPYTTNTAVNGFTYNASNSLSQPHGIGFVWATALWDLTWAYIEKYGFDPDLFNGTGGNNRIMQLVIDGLKLQPCEPGFIDGRDALLAADMATTGGADQCIIWEVFAARGLGFNASQGLSDNRLDQVEDFSMPPSDDPSLANCSSLSVEEFDISSIKVFPNPTQSELTIRVSENLGEALITLVDINGRVVLQKEDNLLDSITLETSGLRAGMYILTIKGDNFSYNEKIIKN